MGSGWIGASQECPLSAHMSSDLCRGGTSGKRRGSRAVSISKENEYQSVISKFKSGTYLPLWGRMHASPANLTELFWSLSFQQYEKWPESSARCTGVTICLTRLHRWEKRRNSGRRCMCRARCSDGQSPEYNSRKSYSGWYVEIWRCGMCCKTWLAREQVLN